MDTMLQSTDATVVVQLRSNFIESGIRDAKSADVHDGT